MTGQEATPREFETLALALDDARARIAAGHTIEVVLEGASPELRDELGAMLELASRVEGLRAEPAPSFAADLEARFLAAVDERAATRPRARETFWGRAWHTRMLRLTGLVIGLGVLLGGGSTAAVQASMSSLPGDTLYPVKEAREAVEGFLARGTTAELQTGELQLGRRTLELQRAVRGGAAPRVVIALEARVVASTRALVANAHDAREGGDAVAAERTQRLLLRVSNVTSELSTSTDSPDVARTLRRLGLYLDGQVRELEEPARPSTAPR